MADPDPHPDPRPDPRPDGTGHPHADAGSRPPARFRPTLSTWMMLPVLLVVVLGVVASRGAPSALVVLGVVGLITAAFSLVSGRRSWASLPSRKSAALVLVGSLVATGFGSSLTAPAIDTTRADAPTITLTPRPTLQPPPTGVPLPVPPATVPSDTAAPPPAPTPPPAPAPAPAPTDAATPTSPTALALVATLPIKGRAPKTGYDRAGQFGAAWLDVDQNGCDTRNDILARDLTSVVRSGACKVLRGQLAEPYRGLDISFRRGNATRLSCRSTTSSPCRTPGRPVRSSSARRSACRSRMIR